MMYELNAASACNLSTVEMLLLAGVNPAEFYEDENGEME